MSMFLNQPPESLIDSELAFECQEVAAQERMRWSLHEQADGSWIATRNRLSETDIKAGIVNHEHSYVMNFINKEFAADFMRWITIRAALEHYEASKKPKLVLVS